MIPYGFFSRTKDDESELQIPFNDEEDGAIIDDFRSDFNLQTQRRIRLVDRDPFFV